MELIIKNKLIKGNLKEILNKVSLQSGRNHFKNIEIQDKNLLITCPFHKNGMEKNPSLSILNDRKNPKVPWGTSHCFTCGYSASLPKLIADCFDKDLNYGEDWLIDNFGSDSVDINIMPKIELDQKSTSKYLDESILDNYSYYHPYMWKRKLSKEIVDKFNVGYDKSTNSLTFPVWDINDKLILITRRSVNSKHFYIDKEKEKPIYLLNYLTKNNIDTFIITEAQIDALTSWSYGFPCCATIGNPSKHQMDILNKSGVNTLITMFDNDESGEKFTSFINNNIRKDILIYNIRIRGNKKDINDLTKEEFWGYLKEIGYENNRF